MQKVIIRNTKQGRLGFYITEPELTRMLKSGTAEQADPNNKYIFNEVEAPEEQPQVYDTRDVVAQPNTRRNRRARARARQEATTDE